MHFHLFFFGGEHRRRRARSAANGGRQRDARRLVAGRRRAVAAPHGAGLKQKGLPKPGEAREWFESELARIKEHIAEQNLKIVLTPEDVDTALKGEPHVVLAVEGAELRR